VANAPLRVPAVTTVNVLFVAGTNPLIKSTLREPFSVTVLPKVIAGKRGMMPAVISSGKKRTTSAPRRENIS